MRSMAAYRIGSTLHNTRRGIAARSIHDGRICQWVEVLEIVRPCGKGFYIHGNAAECVASLTPSGREERNSP